MKNFEEKIESRHFFIGKKKDIVRVCMGARRRKLNRELLGIDREAEKDEESFGFKGCQRGCSRSRARFASFARVFFTYRFYPSPLSGCNRFFIF
jgi:hypothetical protein